MVYFKRRKLLVFTKSDGICYQLDTTSKKLKPTQICTYYKDYSVGKVLSKEDLLEQRLFVLASKKFIQVFFVNNQKWLDEDIDSIKIEIKEGVINLFLAIGLHNIILISKTGQIFNFSYNSSMARLSAESRVTGYTTATKLSPSNRFLFVATSDLQAKLKKIYYLRIHENWAFSEPIGIDFGKEYFSKKGMSKFSDIQIFNFGGYLMVFGMQGSSEDGLMAGYVLRTDNGELEKYRIWVNYFKSNFFRSAVLLSGRGSGGQIWSVDGSGMIKVLVLDYKPA